MKVVAEGYLYKVNNVKNGRQTIKFHKEGLVNDAEQEGTTILELLKVVKSKIHHMEEMSEIDKQEFTEAVPLLNKLMYICNK